MKARGVLQQNKVHHHSLQKSRQAFSNQNIRLEESAVLSWYIESTGGVCTLPIIAGLRR